MEEAVKKIIEEHNSLFGKNPIVNKINIGFTNTIFDINNTYILKICTDINNEEEFKNEISFYNSNKNNELIPKLYYSSINKDIVPYLYEIIEKIKGVPLYNVWHTYSEEKREQIIKQLCDFMKMMHKNKGTKYDWTLYVKNSFMDSYNKVKELNIFSEKELDLLNKAYMYFDKYLETKELVLVHNDLHFDNIFICDEKIKIIDFERSMYAPRDFELDILYRMIRKPWKFASEEAEKYTKANQYSNIMLYIKKYYPEIVNISNLNKRLSIYDVIYYLRQIIEYPKSKELKNDILSASKKVIS